MTPSKLKSLTSEELKRLFEQLCIQQYDAIERNENASYNRRYKKILAIQNELKARPGDQRRILMSLFGHPNMQVRLTAAHTNLAVDYIAARRELQAIIDEQWFPQSGDAGMTLWNIDRGFYRPT
ncbi:DUF2019 domain-containing protein [Bosea sp. (in: a-proteobacteria)]|uniref:DUF2019 domain-containing protein n=1 Tax=Bosea sp. (in: a-proteobacteria) TaxID=1871050 RepID=UPI002621CEDE|nr:DUF2019 domain-containing protein [Bosea sp. (in: a-proteobacteria)]MCO5092302.1 DUF2019 domain-containing protein [Bosea sp. (in: a-proteobacteria)]